MFTRAARLGRFSASLGFPNPRVDFAQAPHFSLVSQVRVTLGADRVSPKPRSDWIYQPLCPQQEEVERAVPSKLPSPTQTSLGLCSGWSRGFMREPCLGAKGPSVFPLLPDDPTTMEQPQPNLLDMQMQTHFKSRSCLKSSIETIVSGVRLLVCLLYRNIFDK